MKINAISSIKNVMMSAVKKVSKESVSGTAVKDGEKFVTTGQDAVAAQNKAMINKVYTKPEMKVNEMQKRDLKAASGIYDQGGSSNKNESTDYFDDEFDYDW